VENGSASSSAAWLINERLLHRAVPSKTLPKCRPDCRFCALKTRRGAATAALEAGMGDA